MKILKIVVILGDGVDLVHIYTDLPSPIPSIYSNETIDLILEFRAIKDTGYSYVIDNFKIIPKVLNGRTK